MSGHAGYPDVSGDISATESKVHSRLIKTHECADTNTISDDRVVSSEKYTGAWGSPVGPSRVTHSNTQNGSHSQSPDGGWNSRVWHSVRGSRSVHKGGRIVVLRRGGITHANVSPFGDGGRPNARLFIREDAKPHRTADCAGVYTNEDSVDTKSVITTESASSAPYRQKTQTCLPVIRRKKANSAKEISCNKTAGQLTSKLRPPSYPLHKASSEVKTRDEGVSESVGSCCHNRRTSNSRADRHARFGNPRPQLQSDKSNRRRENTSSLDSGECKGTYSDFSTITSLSTERSIVETNEISAIDQAKNASDVQLVSETSRKVYQRKAFADGITECKRDTFTRRRYLSDLGAQHLGERESQPSLSPIDEVDTLVSATDVPLARKSDVYEGSLGTEVNGTINPQGMAVPAFDSQNFIHFTTAVSAPIRKKIIRIKSGILQRKVTPQLTPYGRPARHLPVPGSSRARVSRERCPRTPNFEVVGPSGDSSFTKKQLIKKRFFVHESTNLEDILADADDRRIVAICNKFHCEMVAFAKVPKNGSMRHEVILSASCREDIAKCARCLDARLNWCISSQMS